MKKQISELYVITAAKRLVSYLVDIAEKSPKKFRYTHLVKVHDLAYTLIDNLVRANELKIDDLKRKEYQKESLHDLKMIGYLSSLGREMKCYTAHQVEHVSVLLTDCYNALIKWVVSDDRRNNNG